MEFSMNFFDFMNWLENKFEAIKNGKFSTDLNSEDEFLMERWPGLKAKLTAFLKEHTDWEDRNLTEQDTEEIKEVLTNRMIGIKGAGLKLSNYFVFVAETKTKNNKAIAKLLEANRGMYFQGWGDLVANEPNHYRFNQFPHLEINIPDGIDGLTLSINTPNKKAVNLSFVNHAGQTECMDIKLANGPKVKHQGYNRDSRCQSMILFNDGRQTSAPRGRTDNSTPEGTCTLATLLLGDSYYE